MNLFRDSECYAYSKIFPVLDDMERDVYDANYGENSDGPRSTASATNTQITPSSQIPLHTVRQDYRQYGICVEERPSSFLGRLRPCRRRRDKR